VDTPDNITYVLRGSCPLRLRHDQAYTLAQVERIARENDLNLTDGHGRNRFRQARRLLLIDRKGRQMARFDQDTSRRRPEDGGPQSGATGALVLLLALLWISPAAQAAHTWQEQALAAVLVGEAGCQGSNGMVAVAEVVVQRAREARPYFGRTIYGVITRPKAFSCLNRTSVANLVRTSSRSPAWKTALEIAEVACRTPEKLPGLSRQANGFTRKEERPRWARGIKPVVVIKDHAFYRIP
jgi:hypothetical protein